MAKKQKNAIAKETPTIASQSTSKKIGFFSAMLIVMGSSIGAGIFFKAKGVLESSQGSLIFAILAWLIAGFAVIAMALALVEIASARNDNLSLIGWCKVFNSRFVYKASKNFMFYIYLPLTYFFMPLYVILSLQDAIGAFGGTVANEGFGQNSFLIGGTGEADWVIWTIISLCISAFFIFVSGMSSRAGNIMNKAILGVKFIPLVATIVLGFLIAGISGAHVSAGPVLPDQGITSAVNSTNFGFMTPGIGLFIAVGAIFFAYDGFYVTAGLQTEMKEPKKTPLAILFGLGAVTIIYLLIAISMSITGDGGLFGFHSWLFDRNALWVFGVLNLTIAIGVLGIINGFAMWAPRFTEDLIKDYELPFSSRFVNKLNANKPMVGIYYSCAISLPIVVLFTIIGALAYKLPTYGADYGALSMGYLYTFCDLMGTWTAVFAFMFIVFPIFGGIKNRSERFAVTEQKKYFKPMAWCAVIIIGIALCFLFLDAFVNVFTLINMALPGWSDTVAGFELSGVNADGDAVSVSVTLAQFHSFGLANTAELTKFLVASGFTDASAAAPTLDNLSNYDVLIGGEDGVIARVMKLVMLIIFIALMIVPTVIEDALVKRKYGSIDAYEKALGIESTTRTKVAVY